MLVVSTRTRTTPSRSISLAALILYKCSRPFVEQQLLLSISPTPAPPLHCEHPRRRISISPAPPIRSQTRLCPLCPPGVEHTGDMHARNNHPECSSPGEVLVPSRRTTEVLVPEDNRRNYYGLEKSSSRRTTEVAAVWRVSVMTTSCAPGPRNSYGEAGYGTTQPSPCEAATHPFANKALYFG